VITQEMSLGQRGAICHGFATLPTVAPIRVWVVGDDVIRPVCADLVGALMSDLGASAAGAPADCGVPGALDCWATDEPAARNLLVVVVAGDVPPSVELVELVDDWVTTRGFEAVGVFRGYLNPDQVLSAVLRRQHATSWVDDVREVTGGLLDLVLLGDEARRVFISYSRREGAAEAEEIAAVPNERRFDVFLDRFRLAPGAGLGGTGRR
jgi:hypothetical protein